MNFLRIDSTGRLNIRRRESRARRSRERLEPLSRSDTSVNTTYNDFHMRMEKSRAFPLFGIRDTLFTIPPEFPISFPSLGPRTEFPRRGGRERIEGRLTDSRGRKMGSSEDAPLAGSTCTPFAAVVRRSGNVDGYLPGNLIRTRILNCCNVLDK